MENKDGQQKNGKRPKRVWFAIALAMPNKTSIRGKQKNGKQKWKTNNTQKIITSLQVKW